MMDKKHEVLIGPYRNGKSWFLLERVIEHCLNKPSGEKAAASIKSKTIVLVPSNRYRKLVERRLTKLIGEQQLGEQRKDFAAASNSFAPISSGNKIAGLLGLEILTINQFCQESLFQAGMFLKVLPETVRMPLLSNISKRLIEEGQIKQLAPILPFAGTQKSVLSLIDEWQRAAYSASEITKKTKEAAEQNKELAKIYSAYEKALSKINYVDRHSLIMKCTDVLNENKQLDWLSNFIVFDGFDRFNALQLALVKALARHVERVYISFDYEKPQENLFEEYAWKERSYEQINALLGKIFEFKEMSGASAAQTAPAIIDCFATSDRLTEMGIIAARVKSAILLGKAKPNEIVVTARNLLPYKAAIEAAFNDAGLEYYMDESTSIQALPIISFLRYLLALADNDFKRKEVIYCLRSPYLRLSAFGLNAGDIELLDTLSLKTNVVAGQEQWGQATKSAPKLAKALNYFFQELKATHNEQSAIGYVSWVEDLIDKLLDLSCIDDLDPMQAWQQKEALAQYRKQLASLIQEETILNLLNGEAKNKIATSASYYEKLASLLEAANFASPPQNANQVLIASAELIPNQKYKQIYLAGLVESEFPAIKNSNGFLSAREIEQWRGLGIHMYNPRMEAGFEYALFASLINRAQEKITLSYPTIEMTASKEELLPSFFFNAIAVEPNSVEFITSEQSISAFNSPRNTLACLLWGGQNIDSIVQRYKAPAIQDFIDQLQEKFSFAEIRSKQLLESPVNGYLVDYVAASTTKISLPEYWNAGQLNDYGKCPFNYWLTRMLKITPPEEPEIGLNARDRGTFYHKALELFYQKVIDNKIAINFQQQEVLQKLFDKTVLEALQWLEKEPWFRASEFWAQEKNTLLFRLNNFFAAEFNRFVSENGQFEPYMVEAVFGPDSAYGPLVMTNNGRTIKLRGKIDRIDVETGSRQGKKLRVIDYKSGSSPINQEDFESGRNMQLPLYALAAEKSILPESKVSHYQYSSISTGKALSAKRDNEIDVQADFKTLEERVFEFVDNIEKGDFSVRPSNDKVCLTCIHSKVCRIKEFPAK